jgi:uroporphyrinogen III methyltransferase / synthase
MMQDKPLSGKRIVITRPPEQSDSLVRDLKAAGAETTVLPCVEFRPPEDRGSLDATLSRIGNFDWVVLTSPNAAKFFCDGLRRVNRSPKSLTQLGVKVAVIGASTQLEATQEKLDAKLAAPDVRSGSEFVAAFSPNVRGKKILMPQSDLATPHVAEGLREAGAEVTSVVAYRTCMPESLDIERVSRIRREGADVFIFASPSAFRNFAKIVGKAAVDRFAAQAAFAAIGPTTAQAIREADVAVEIMALKPSSTGIIEAMIEYFANEKSQKARP